MSSIKSLDEITARDAALVGGKALNCARLRRAGLPVPDGFVVLAGAEKDPDFGAELDAILRTLPAGAVGAVLVLTDSDALESRVKHAGPPPAVPGKVWVSGQIGVDAEAILDLRRALGRDVVRGTALMSEGGNGKNDDGQEDYDQRDHESLTREGQLMQWVGRRVPIKIA